MSSDDRSRSREVSSRRCVRSGNASMPLSRSLANVTPPPERCRWDWRRVGAGLGRCVANSPRLIMPRAGQGRAEETRRRPYCCRPVGRRRRGHALAPARRSRVGAARRGFPRAAHSKCHHSGRACGKGRTGRRGFTTPASGLPSPPLSREAPDGIDRRVEHPPPRLRGAVLFDRSSRSPLLGDVRAGLPDRSNRPGDAVRGVERRDEPGARPLAQVVF